MSKEHAAALQRLVQDQDAAQRKLAEDIDARLCECHQQQESALLAQFKDMEKKRSEMEAQLLVRSVRIDNMQQETAKPFKICPTSNTTCPNGCIPKRLYIL